MGTSRNLFFEGIVPTRKASAHVRLHANGHEGTARQGQADQFFADLFDRGGLRVECYRKTSLDRRFHACLRAAGSRDATEAMRKLDANPALLQSVLDAVLLGVTEFGRDPVVFETLREKVIPALRNKSSKIRVWSAACSEGHELYSLTILLADAGLLEHCELVGTDCRSRAIEQAQAGLFTTEELAKLSAESRTRYFRQEGPYARVTEKIASSIRWSRADLLTRTEPGPWDLILWRNMAIYLVQEAADIVWSGLTRQLRTGGYLVVGKADHPPRGLGLNRIATCVYQKG